MMNTEAVRIKSGKIPGPPERDTRERGKVMTDRYEMQDGVNAGHVSAGHVNAVQMQPDVTDAPLAIPAGRLDADQYSAEDLDGVTESIFGSGNMAYASMQASQTDAALILNGGAVPGFGDEIRAAAEAEGGSGPAVSEDSAEAPDSAFAEPAGGRESDVATDMDRPVDFGDGADTENPGAAGGFSNVVVGTGASALSAGAGAFSRGQGGGGDVFNVENGGDSESETIVNEGDNIDNIDNITNINNGGDTTVGDTVTNIVNIGGDLLGDTINTVNNEIAEITDILNTEIEYISETVTTIFENTGITEIVNQVTNVTNELTESVTNILNGVLPDGGISIDLVTDALDTLGTGLHVTIDDGIAGQFGTDIVSGGLVSLVGDLTGISPDLVADAGIDVGFNLLGNAGADEGADIVLAGTGLPEISLDPVENIVGDIDIEADLPLELADPGALADAAGSIVEGLGGLNPAEIGEVLDIIGAQGADGLLEIELADAVLGQEFGVTVDDVLGIVEDAAGGGVTEGIADAVSGIVEDPAPDGLLGDLVELADNTADDLIGLAGDALAGDALDAAGAPDAGLDVDDAIALLSSGEDGVIGIAGGLADEGDSMWTEIADGGDLLSGDVLSGGFADALPDPSGTVAEGLGGLVLEAPHTGAGGLGGLFG